MSALALTIGQLRDLIGTPVRHRNTDCVIIELLEEGPHLVLQEVIAGRGIQPDQFGEAHRRVPVTHTVPVHVENSNELHPAFMALQVMHRIDNN